MYKMNTKVIRQLNYHKFHPKWTRRMHWFLLLSQHIIHSFFRSYYPIQTIIYLYDHINWFEISDISLLFFFDYMMLHIYARYNKPCDIQDPMSGSQFKFFHSFCARSRDLESIQQIRTILLFQIKTFNYQSLVFKLNEWNHID